MDKNGNDDDTLPKLVVVNDIPEIEEMEQEQSQEEEGFGVVVKVPPTKEELEHGLEAPPDVIGEDVGSDDDEVKFSSYGVRRQFKGQELMLDLQFKDGTLLGLGYIQMTSIRLNASTGLLLDFTGVIIHIEGRNLRPLYNALLRHAVTFIREQDPLYDEEDRQTSFVAKITVKEFM